VKPSVPQSRLWHIERLEWAVSISAPALSTRFHLTLHAHVGALWRDKMAGVPLAMLPTLGEVWHWLMHDTLPLLFPLLVRGGPAVGLGKSDSGLRTLGLLVGVGLVHGATLRNAVTGRFTWIGRHQSLDHSLGRFFARLRLWGSTEATEPGVGVAVHAVARFTPLVSGEPGSLPERPVPAHQRVSPAGRLPDRRSRVRLARSVPDDRDNTRNWCSTGRFAAPLLRADSSTRAVLCQAHRCGVI